MAVRVCMVFVANLSMVLYGSSGCTIMPTPPYPLLSPVVAGASEFPSNACVRGSVGSLIHVSVMPRIIVSVARMSTGWSLFFNPLVLKIPMFVVVVWFFLFVVRSCCVSVFGFLLLCLSGFLAIVCVSA